MVALPMSSDKSTDSTLFVEFSGAAGLIVLVTNYPSVRSLCASCVGRGIDRDSPKNIGAIQVVRLSTPGLRTGRSFQAKAATLHVLDRTRRIDCGGLDGRMPKDRLSYIEIRTVSQRMTPEGVPQPTRRCALEGIPVFSTPLRVQCASKFFEPRANHPVEGTGRDGSPPCWLV